MRVALRFAYRAIAAGTAMTMLWPNARLPRRQQARSRAEHTLLQSGFVRLEQIALAQILEVREHDAALKTG
jgi:hypothetical protein